jgi:hypothetical protein
MKFKSSINAVNLTAVERDALTAVEGDMIYNTDINQYQYYDGTSWDTFGSGGGGAVDLDDLVDVTITSPQRNQMLRYDDGIGQWVNKRRYESQIIVQSLADLPAPVGAEIQLATDTIYVIDADLDITGYTLVFGAKTQINGLGQNVSRIRSSTSGVVGTPYVFFKSTANLFMNDLEIICDGTNQRVWECIGDGVTVPEGESFELNRFNCLSFPPGGPPLWGHNNELGFIKDIRQGFIGTFSCFGFENGFTCAGAWDGGFRVDNTLFRVFAGTAFGSDPLDPVTFQLRMSSNANLSIPSGSIGYDFPPTAFVNTGQYQLQNGNVSGDGTHATEWEDPANPGTFRSPAFDPKANFQNNTGLQNTYQGGEWTNNADNITTINTINVWEDLVVTTDNKFLTWFEESNGVFTYKGGTPIDVRIDIFPSLTGKANDIVQIRIIKVDALAVLTELKVSTITIQGTTAQGRAENVGVATTDQLVLDDQIKFQVRNTSGTSDVTCLNGVNAIIGAK